MPSWHNSLTSENGEVAMRIFEIVQKNSYLIKYKIATVAQLTEPFTLAGYDFRSYTESYWDCEAWIASKSIEAGSSGEALQKFMKGLIPEIEKCSAISQCAFRLVANTYIIYRKNNNPNKVIYIYYVEEVGTCPLQFEDIEINQLQKFDKIPKNKGLFFLMEAANAATFYTRLTMLLASAEAFAGESRKGKKVMTNHVALKKILGEELHKKLYAYGKGLRNQLIHGNIKTHQLFDGLTSEVYRKLCRYLKDKYDIEIDSQVVDPQRSFYGNFRQMSTYEELRDDSTIDLSKIEEAINESNSKHFELEKELFTGKAPEFENY